MPLISALNVSWVLAPEALLWRYDTAVFQIGIFVGAHQAENKATGYFVAGADDGIDQCAIQFRNGGCIIFLPLGV